jgi:hypothetical protein
MVKYSYEHRGHAMLSPAAKTTLPGDDLIAAAVAAAQSAPNPFADTFARIWRIASRKQEVDACDASNISTIEGIAERIERNTGDRLARVVIILCNTQRCAADQMDDVAAAVSARAAILQAVA